MEDEEPEETKDNKGSAGTTNSKKVLGKYVRQGNNSGEGSDKITSSSENEVEEIPKDDETHPNVLQINPVFGRSRTFDGTIHESPLSDHSNSMVHHLSDNRESSSFTLVKYPGGRPGLFMMTTRSPHSSSSQEDYEPEVKPLHAQNKKNLLVTTGSTSQVTARSMESLRTSRNLLDPESDYAEDSRSLESLYTTAESQMTASSSRSHHRSFLTSSKLDVRRIHAAESRSSENLHREESLKAEIRRGLFAAMDRNKLQHLSLPGANNFISLTSPGGSDRRITILSPHSPLTAPDLQQAFAMGQTLKSRRKRAIVLPRLVLVQSESPVSE
jgi:hypothetical protein